MVRTRPPKGARPNIRARTPDLVTIIEANARHCDGQHFRGPSLFPLRPNWKALRHLVFACWKRSNLLDGIEVSRHADALLAVSSYWREWLRPLSDWQPPAENARVQLGSLVRYLFARYDVPAFLDAAWHAGLTEDGSTQQRWFKWIGAGQNIRTAADLPLPLTRRMAHHLLQVPPDLGILAAFRYAQILGLGGDARLARSLMATRLATDFDAPDFWESVVRWLIEHPEIEAAQHGPIIDYLHHQRFVPSCPSGLGRGQPRLAPCQPNLCMNGRTAQSLLRAVEKWHRQLWSQRGPTTSWRPSGIPPVTFTETEEGSRRVFAITELICSNELQEEGLVMGHCVASYRSLCESGQSSIWSLTVEDVFGQFERLLTLEVRNWSREIVQARGKYNRAPHPDELHLVERWAHEGGPCLSPALEW